MALSRRNGRSRVTLLFLILTSITVLTLDYERFRRFIIAFPEGTIALLKSAVLRQIKMREDI